MNDIGLQDRGFFAAVREGHEPKACARQVRRCYGLLLDLERQFASG